MNNQRLFPILFLLILSVNTFARELKSYPEKIRILILTDIENEPDDAESLVRFLLYSNQFDVEGIVATTSCWQRDQIAEWQIHEIVDEDDPRAVWIPIWWGANCLAQALWKVKNNRPEEELKEFLLDASVSVDPDRDNLSYEWIFCREAGIYPAMIKFENKYEAKLKLTAPLVDEPKQPHFVVAVMDDGEPILTNYKRVILTVNP